MNKNKLAVIILHFGKISLTYDCLKSVLASDYDNRSLTIFVVDNSEEQDFSLKGNHTGMNTEVLRTGKNLGYAGGMNYGIKKALDRGFLFIFLLNNDAFIEKNSISKLYKFLESSEKIGIASPLILHKNNPNKIWATGSLRNPGWARMSDPYHNRRYEQIFPSPVKVLAVTGCSMMVKSKVFRDIGLFDENYFAYYEDVDFCYRARRFGHDIYFYPLAIVYHVVSGSTKLNRQMKKSSDYFMIKNRIYFMKKYSRRTTLSIFYSLILIESVIKFIKDIIRFRFKNFAAFLLGIYDGLLWSPQEEHDVPQGNITACIITKNTENTIERCLKSLCGVVKEIVIVDTGSIDKTLSICRKYACNIYTTKFNKDFSEIRNFAASCASNPWILALDADEYLSEELRFNLNLLTASQECWGYYFERVNFYEDKVIRFGYPGVDLLLRLYRKKGSFFCGKVHEKVITQGYALKTHYKIFHKPGENNYTLKSFRNKWLSYIYIETENRAKSSKKRGLVNLLLSPFVFVFTLFLDLIILFGILDGFKGFKIAYLRARYRFSLHLEIFKQS